MNVGCYTDAHLKNQKKTWRDSALTGLDAPRFFLVFQVGFDNILVGFPRPRKKNQPLPSCLSMGKPMSLPSWIAMTPESPQSHLMDIHEASCLLYSCLNMKQLNIPEYLSMGASTTFMDIYEGSFAPARNYLHRYP